MRLQAFVLRETGPAGRLRSVPPGVACPRTASTGHDPSCWVAWLLCPNLYPFLPVLFPGCLSFPCPSFLLRRDPCRHRLPFHLSGNRPAEGTPGSCPRRTGLCVDAPSFPRRGDNLGVRLAMKRVATVFSIMFFKKGGQTGISRRNEISTAKCYHSLLTKKTTAK